MASSQGWSSSGYPMMSGCGIGTFPGVACGPCVQPMQVTRIQVAGPAVQPTFAMGPPPGPPAQQAGRVRRNSGGPLMPPLPQVGAMPPPVTPPSATSRGIWPGSMPTMPQTPQAATPAPAPAATPTPAAAVAVQAPAAVPETLPQQPATVMAPRKTSATLAPDIAYTSSTSEIRRPSVTLAASTASDVTNSLSAASEIRRPSVTLTAAPAPTPAAAVALQAPAAVPETLPQQPATVMAPRKTSATLAPDVAYTSSTSEIRRPSVTLAASTASDVTCSLSAASEIRRPSVTLTAAPAPTPAAAVAVQAPAAVPETLPQQPATVMAPRKTSATLAPDVVYTTSTNEIRRPSVTLAASTASDVTYSSPASEIRRPSVTITVSNASVEIQQLQREMQQLQSDRALDQTQRAARDEEMQRLRLQLEQAELRNRELQRQVVEGQTQSAHKSRNGVSRKTLDLTAHRNESWQEGGMSDRQSSSRESSLGDIEDEDLLDLSQLR
eukprot:TRINITY_DN4374_c0_g1_i1.p1 TRINITY_DN4374_c0_g1~~TRINITY_DN4374_c0_g1_i1.p1  ORF type:complete len:496 (-),score=66.30 TRINITY_DN4374_c0_g1_i1:89-1576(-)